MVPEEPGATEVGNEEREKREAPGPVMTGFVRVSGAEAPVLRMVTERVTMPGWVGKLPKSTREGEASSLTVMGGGVKAKAISPRPTRSRGA